MTTYFSRSASEQAVITAAYEFEKAALLAGDIDTHNPYLATMKQWPDFTEVYEALCEAVEAYFG